MTVNKSGQHLLLSGLDGSNPLGFLAAIGTLVVLNKTFPEICLGWESTDNGWRPLLKNCCEDKNDFSEKLLAALRNAPMTVFNIDKRMPFEITKFSHALREAQHSSSMQERRDADLLCAFGTDLYPNEKSQQFQDSSFRMVRSGDSAGQGLPLYVKDSRKKINLDHIQRTLFHTWDYLDKGYSLRWDPIEDQRYALRWRDPSKSDDLGTMWAANNLAAEALQLFPSLLVGKKIQTTGFQRLGRREIYFIWPIWTPMVKVDSLRSLLALSDIHKEQLQSSSLSRRGIEEVYRSRRIAQNQYYSNFLPAQPL